MGGPAIDARYQTLGGEESKRGESGVEKVLRIGFLSESLL